MVWMVAGFSLAATLFVLSTAAFLIQARRASRGNRFEEAITKKDWQDTMKRRDVP